MHKKQITMRKTVFDHRSYVWKRIQSLIDAFSIPIEASIRRTTMYMQKIQLIIIEKDPEFVKLEGTKTY